MALKTYTFSVESEWPEWVRLFMADDERKELYVSARLLSSNEASPAILASEQKIPFITYEGHHYMPMSWICAVYPEYVENAKSMEARLWEIISPKTKKRRSPRKKKTPGVEQSPVADDDAFDDVPF